MSADDQKRIAGEAAAQQILDGMVVGLGTGSTAAWFVRALAARKLGVTCVSTSEATARLAADLGLKLIELDQASGGIDVTVDGADEVGPGLTLIKGGGAALLREKLVWEASRRCVVIADAAKDVAVLGRFLLPVEVVAFGHATTARRLEAVLAGLGYPAPVLRMRDAGVVLTDGGNVIYDVPCGAITDPAALAEALKLATGVVEHGLFIGLASEAIFGTDDGVLRRSA